MLCFVKREWAFVNCTNRCYQLNYTTKGKLEKGVELQISCAECVVNRPKVCRTYWRGVGQTKYFSWGATQLLQILFFEMLKDLSLISEVLPWYSKTQPKPLYENGSVQALWNVPVYADSIKVRANRIDARSSSRQRAETSVSHWNERSLVG